MYAVSFIYQNLSSHYFPFFILLRQVCFSPRTIDFLHRYHRRRLNILSKSSISLSPTSVTYRSDCCHHPQFKPNLSYFHHLVGVRAAAVHEEACVEADRRSIERPEAAVSYAYICAYIRIYLHIYMHSESQCSFSFEQEDREIF